VRSYLVVLLVSIGLVSVLLAVENTVDSFPEALRVSAFQVISVATTTGYSSANYALWPAFAPVLLVFLGCFVSCAGSTGGGIKMVRMILLVKQAKRELVRAIHPRVVNPVHLGGTAISNAVLMSVMAFMLIYGATIITLTMVLLYTGMDMVSAFTAVVATVNNIGPGLGNVGPAANYGSLTDFQTWVCTVAMMLGRLELLSVLVLFTAQFWRK
jgi:trk system potassium uptake protein TrkH